MKNGNESTRCPICGHEVQGKDHSRMGERKTPDGPVEYWACFQGHDVFSCRQSEREREESFS